MNRAKHIQLVQAAEIDLIRSQSALLLQKREGGYSGELKSAGTMIENYIKDLLKKHMPAGYRLCSGYIATTKPENPNANLQQHDLLIVDSRLPAIYEFGYGDIEVIPAEAVCGVIEIKRTLTVSSLSSAIEHLRKTKLLLETHRQGIKSKNSFGEKCKLLTYSGSNAPIYAVLSLDLDMDINDETIIPLISASVVEFVDLIWPISSPWVAHYANGPEANGNTVPLHLYRKYTGLVDSFGTMNLNHALRARVFGFSISLIRNWIYQTTGAATRVDIDAQYLGVFDSYSPDN